MNFTKYAILAEISGFCLISKRMPHADITEIKYCCSARRCRPNNLRLISHSLALDINYKSFGILDTWSLISYNINLANNINRTVHMIQHGYQLVIGFFVELICMLLSSFILIF